MALTAKQLEYLANCDHRWNVKTGATGSGKSWVDFAVTIPQRVEACRGEGLIVLMGNTRGTLERNILEPMRQIWPHCVGGMRSDNTVSIFGKKCYALGADNKKHVARIQGATFEYVYGDEVTTWSEDVFQMLKSRLRCEHSHFDGTCNPASPNHWFKRFLESDADIYHQHYAIEDGVLPEYIVEELKREYAGTVYEKWYIRGEWAQAQGLVYPNHVMCLEDTWEPPAGYEPRYCISCDYGTQNPFAALKWALDPHGAWHCIDEYYYGGRDEGHQKTDADYADDMEAFRDGIPGTVDFIVDPSAASFIAELRKRSGFRVLRADNDVANGIRRTSTCIQTGRVKVSRACESTVGEFSSYVWDDRRHGDEVLKENDHAMDAMRYFVNTKMLYRQHRAYASPFEM